jgi:hypothetical protein
MLNYYYSDNLSDFVTKAPETIIGEISDYLTQGNS